MRKHLANEQLQLSRIGVVAHGFQRRIRPPASRRLLGVVYRAHEHLARLGLGAQPSHVRLHPVLEQVHHVPEPGRPSSTRPRDAPGHSASEASQVHSEVGGRRARATLQARGGSAAHQRREIDGRAEQGLERHVVTTDAHHQHVVARDVVPDELILRQEPAERSVVEARRLHRGVDAPHRFTLRDAPLVDPVAHVLLHHLRREELLVPVQRLRHVVEPVLVIQRRIPGQEDDALVPPSHRRERHRQVLDVVTVKRGVKVANLGVFDAVHGRRHGRHRREAPSVVDGFPSVLA